MSTDSSNRDDGRRATDVELVRVASAAPDPDALPAESAAPHTLVLDANGAGQLTIPGGTFLLHADYVREGPDLLLIGADGQRILIRDFFANEFPADLISDTALRIDADLAARLAGPVAPGEFAQAEDAPAAQPIGRVETLQGTVTASRVDGSTVTLEVGAPIFEGDVLETAEGAAIGIVFLDDSTFSLDEDGSVEALRVLRTTRKTAIKCRRAALQQLYNTIVAAPEEVRDQVRNLTRMRRLRTCAAWRPDAVGYRDPVVATKLSLKSLARRILDLNDEIAELDRFIVPLVEELAPSLLELEGVGTENAGAVMVAVGDNPDRLRSEASFAMMCGVCPIPASSGKTQRHRLNRGGNRQANSALHMVVVCRMRTDERTRAYVARRTLEGLSKREIMRCLKRYVAREIYRVLTAPSRA